MAGRADGQNVAGEWSKHGLIVIIDAKQFFSVPGKNFTPGRF
jgi:hypothetical protein